ncbi:Uma2 family endonuclease [Parablautia intestinalis]|uniref:Uma2 family endonuclease n=1 Tax=Parablautia intestinalis TaxID=2320100 RepID=A0A3A9APP2_9FIRM|nr:Uma2 family endonuclease [Parablautia intestinalis]
MLSQNYFETSGSLSLYVALLTLSIISFFGKSNIPIRNTNTSSCCIDAAPDRIIEIVLSSTERIDYGVQLFKYRSAGVCEYWIANPGTRIINVYDFESKKGTCADFIFWGNIPALLITPVYLRLKH